MELLEGTAGKTEGLGKPGAGGVGPGKGPGLGVALGKGEGLTRGDGLGEGTSAALRKFTSRLKSLSRAAVTST